MIEKTFPITEKLLNNGLNSAQKLLELLNSESENLKLKTDPNTLLTIVADKNGMWFPNLKLFRNSLVKCWPPKN